MDGWSGAIHLPRKWYVLSCNSNFVTSLTFLMVLLVAISFRKHAIQACPCQPADRLNCIPERHYNVFYFISTPWYLPIGMWHVFFYSLEIKVLLHSGRLYSTPPPLAHWPMVKTTSPKIKKIWPQLTDEQKNARRENLLHWRMTLSKHAPCTQTRRIFPRNTDSMCSKVLHGL